MKRLFILFVMVHLFMDLAIPSAGAFRFDPDESVLALRVQPVPAQEVASPPQTESLAAAAELPRVALKVPADLRRCPNLRDLIPLLPRRDPSADGSPPESSRPGLTSVPSS